MNQYSDVNTQIQKGREALLFFHNDSVIYPNYGLTFDQLLNQVSQNKPSIFLEGFGFAIESLDDGGFFSFGTNKVKNAMQALADKAQGRIPASRNSFYSALSDEAMNYSFVDAAGFTATETAKTVGNGLVDVGDGIITTLSSLKNILPLLLVGGLVFFVYSKIKKVSA